MIKTFFFDMQKINSGQPSQRHRPVGPKKVGILGAGMMGRASRT